MERLKYVSTVAPRRKLLVLVTNKGPPEHDPEILKVKFIIRAHKAHPPAD